MVFAMQSLKYAAVDNILMASNRKEALGALWGAKDMIPNIIKEKRKLCESAMEQLMYSFNRHILTEIWGCPEQYIDEYADDTDIDSILDQIIYGPPIDIMETPEPILEMLDKRDMEICETDVYKSHFIRLKEDVAYADTVPGLRYRWNNDQWVSNEREIVRIAETQYGDGVWTVSEHSDRHRPTYQCGCGSKYFEDECVCYYDKNCRCDSWFTGMTCICGAEDQHEFLPTDLAIYPS